MGEDRRNLNRFATLVVDAGSMSGPLFNSREGKEISLSQLLTSSSMPQIESLKFITSSRLNDLWYHVKEPKTPSSLISAVQEATSSTPRFPVLKELTIRGSFPLSPMEAELPNLRYLRLEVDSPEIPNSLLAHTNLTTTQQLYLSGDNMRPSYSGVNFLPIVEQAINVQTITITPSLDESVRRVVHDRVRVPEITTIPIHIVYPHCNNSDDDMSFGLFD